jgi:hypothetical protein
METSLVEQFKQLDDDELHEIVRIIEQGLLRRRLRQGHRNDPQERPEHRACRRPI